MNRTDNQRNKVNWPMVCAIALTVFAGVMSYRYGRVWEFVDRTTQMGMAFVGMGGKFQSLRTALLLFLLICLLLVCGITIPSMLKHNEEQQFQVISFFGGTTFLSVRYWIFARNRKHSLPVSE